MMGYHPSWGGVGCILIRLHNAMIHNSSMMFKGKKLCWVVIRENMRLITGPYCLQVKPVSLDNVMSKCAYMLLYAR